MLKLLIVDESACKKELSLFMKQNKKAVRFLTTTRDFAGRMQSLLGRTDHSAAISRRLAVNTTESLSLLNINEIIRCESNRNYTFIYLTGKKKLIVSKTLMEFEDVLTKYNFLRIHKSHLINVNYIDRYMKSEGGYMVLTDGTRLPVAVRKKEYLFRELEKL
ncbi:MAG: LytR/AlgR family response regulator transcription factor [Bacteroidia bacterium]